MPDLTIGRGQNMPAAGPEVHAKVGTAGKESEADGLRQAARDFEAIFLETVLKSMRKSVIKSGFIDGGNAEEIYRGMLDSEYARSMSGQGQTGLAEMIEQQLRETRGVERKQTLQRHREALNSYQSEIPVNRAKALLSPKGS